MATVYNFPAEAGAEIAVDLGQLRDVSVPAPEGGDSLIYDPVRREWISGQPVVNVPIGGLNDLTDVQVTGPQDLHQLWYDFASGLWYNAPAPVIDIGDLNDLNDVDTTGAQENDSLVLQGGVWSPGQGSRVDREDLTPAAFALARDTFFNNFIFSSDITFTLAAGSVDGRRGVANLQSDGSSVITWGPEFRRVDTLGTDLPTVLPLGDNVISFIYDGIQDLMLVDIRTDWFRTDGSIPMTGDLQMAGRNIIDINSVRAEHILREPFTAPTSGSFAPDFGTRSDFDHGVINGDLTIGSPLNQEKGQSGYIEGDNSAGHTITLPADFRILNEQPTAIGAVHFILPYRVRAPGVIAYSIETFT